jgi:hypothetical protein
MKTTSWVLTLIKAAACFLLLTVQATAFVPGEKVLVPAVCVGVSEEFMMDFSGQVAMEGSTAYYRIMSDPKVSCYDGRMYSPEPQGFSVTLKDRLWQFVPSDDDPFIMWTGTALDGSEVYVWLSVADDGPEI